MDHFKPLILVCCFFLYLPHALAYPSISAIDKQQKNIRSLLAKDPQLAEKLAKQALKDSEILGIDSLIAKSKYLYGIACYYQSKFKQSAQLYEQALQSDYAQKNDVFRGALWNNLGINYEFNLLYQEALRAYYESLRISEKQADSNSIAMSWINIGLLHYKIGDTVKSDQLFHDAQTYFEQKRDTANLALCEQNLAIGARDRGDYDQFKRHSLRAAKFFHSLGYLQDEMGIYCDLAENGQTEHEINDFYNRAKLLNQHTQDSAMNTRLEIIEGDLHLRKQHYTAAKSLFLKAREELLARGDRQRANDLLIKLAEAHARSGDFDRFATYMERARVQNSRLFQETTNENMAKLKLWYETDKKEEKIAHQATLITFQRKLKWFWMSLALAFALVTAYIGMLNSKYRKANRYLFNLNKEQILLTDMVAKPQEVSEESMNTIEQRRMEKLFQQIVGLIQQSENVTNPQFGVAEVAQALHTNEKYVSQAVNQIGGMNFNKLLNSYRINAAKKMLLDPNYLHLSVEQIADRCGFGNPNTFYIRFKDFTGLTPRKFRNMHLK